MDLHFLSPMCLSDMHIDSFTFVTFKVITVVFAEVSALLECEVVLWWRIFSNILHKPCCVSEFSWQRGLYLVVYVF